MDTRLQRAIDSFNLNYENKPRKIGIEIEFAGLAFATVVVEATGTAVGIAAAVAVAVGLCSVVGSAHCLGSGTATKP